MINYNYHHNYFRNMPFYLNDMYPAGPIIR
jgi:hypothetical protein